MNFRRFVQPYGFVIQWHLTENCNWHCRHCYQEKNEFQDLSFKELKIIFNQCLELFRALHIPDGMAHITVGGGEPFLRKDFFEFLGLLKKYSNSISLQIMTNGSLITKSVAKDLVGRGVKKVQLSLEGLEETNDRIRGKGSFGKVINAIKILKKHKIGIRLSLTLTRLNLAEMEEAAIYLKSIGVNSFGIRRYVPMGRGAQLKEYALSPLELRDYYFARDGLKKRLDEPGKFVITYGCEDAIFASQTNFYYYNCGVVKGCYLAISANGDILACRRFPVILGNVFKNSLLNVYFSSAQLWNLRNLDNAHRFCKKCLYFKYCLGGAKCAAFAYFKNPFTPDPQCWKLFKELPQLNKRGHIMS